MKRKKVAAIITEYRMNSHADMIIGRLLGEFGFESRLEVVSLYTDQVPDNDLSRDIAEKHGIKICATIEEAVAFGSPDDTVEGILVICEHGNYPWNEKEQRMYPRRRFMEETLEAMDRHGIHAPIFLDKHLAYNNEDAFWIYNQVKQRQIPFMAGSSIPHMDPNPAYDPMFLKSLKQILVVSHQGNESYGFHAMDLMQSLAEKRNGAETGIESVAALAGDEMWHAMDRGAWPEHLLQQALSVQQTVSDLHPRAACSKPVLFIVKYKDGTTGYVAQLQNYVKNWSYALENNSGFTIAAKSQVGEDWPYAHFSTLTALIEDMIITGNSSFKIERTLFSTIMINTAMESLFQKRRLQLPELTLKYDPE